MLDTALGFFTNELNSFLAARMGPSSVEVTLTRLVNENGRYGFPEESLGLSLINLEEERTFRAQLPTHTTLGGQHVVQEPSLKLNLSVLVAAHFRRYEEALKYLSCVLTYFQAHPSFTPDQYPGLDPRIERLTAELQSPNYEQLNQIWAFVGGKQLPSAIYRIRMVALQDREVAQVRPPVTTIATTVRSR